MVPKKQLSGHLKLFFVANCARTFLSAGSLDFDFAEGTELLATGLCLLVLRCVSDVALPGLAIAWHPFSEGNHTFPAASIGSLPVSMSDFMLSSPVGLVGSTGPSIGQGWT